MVSVVASKRAAAAGTVTTSQSMTPPRASYVSRIKMRLLSDTRRELEYLSNADVVSQVCDMHDEMMKR